MSSDLLPNPYRCLTAFWSLPYDVHHFKMCIFHLLCRYLNKIVLFKHLVIINNLICAFHPEASKYFAKWKIQLLSCPCFGSWNTEKFSDLSRASDKGGRRDTWSSQTLVLSLVHSTEHWFTLCSPYTLYGVGQNSPYRRIVPGLCILEGLKWLKFA